MGEAKRRRASDTYIQSRGTEAYRGHVIDKMFVRLAGVPFWRVDIKTLGMVDADALITLQDSTAKASLEKLVSEAKRLIGHIIHEGAGIPATSVPVGHLATKADPLDSLISRSTTGKPSVCLRHWEAAKAAARVGKSSLLVYNIALMQRFTAKLYADGMLAARMTPGAAQTNFTMNMLWDAYSPICCWLGDDVVDDVLAKSDPNVLIGRARDKGVL